MKRTIDSLRAEGIIYRGILFAGFVLTKSGPQLLEFNCRFGDPETQSILSLLQSDLFEIMQACLQGHLSNMEVNWKAAFACTVVCTAAGYPGSYERGMAIHGLDDPYFADHDVRVFHYNTVLDPEEHIVVSNSGRVLAVSSVADSLPNAVRLAYEGVEHVCFRGIHFRKDIGQR